MNNLSKIDMNPAYYIVDKNNKNNETIAILAIKFIDEKMRPRVTPSIENSINRVIEITKKEGVLIHNINSSNITLLKEDISKAFKCKDAFILIVCESDLMLEQVMEKLYELFDLYLVREN